jgi:hypothetical protein
MPIDLELSECMASSKAKRPMAPFVTRAACVGDGWVDQNAC